MDATWKHPFTCVVAGPTSCGKTTFVLKLVQDAPYLIDPPPQNILWIYDHYQDVYSTLEDRVTFSTDLEDLDQLPKERRHLVVVDDKMGMAGTKMADLFTKGSHHRNISVVYIVQNLFDQTKEHRGISLNAHYMVVFKNPREKTQISVLARQARPGTGGLVLRAFEQATARPHGYLFFDFRQETPEEIRIRTNVLPSEPGPHRVFAIVPREEEKELEV